MRAALSMFRFLVLCTLIAGFGLVLADQENQPPSSPQNPATIKVGARPPGRIAFISEGAIWVMNTDGSNRQKISAVTNAKGRLSFSPARRPSEELDG